MCKRTFSWRCVMGLALVVASCATKSDTQPPAAAMESAPAVIESTPLAPTAQPVTEVAPATDSAAQDWQSRRALIVIPVTLTRNYFEAPLGEAINEALAIRPDLRFDLVAVAPVLNSPKDQDKVDEITKASAGEVLLALSRLGFDGTRVAVFSLSDTTTATPEIRLYPR